MSQEGKGQGQAETPEARVLVGIVLGGVGVVPLEEFREATDPAAAVAAFCVSPPANPADYFGVDTGWPAGDARLLLAWAWDFTGGALVQIGWREPILDDVSAHRDERLTTVVRAEYPAASGVLFGCSVAEQDSWSKLATLDARSLVAYPFRVWAADHDASHDLTDSADLTAAIAAVSLAVLTERATADGVLSAVAAASDEAAAIVAAAAYLVF